jgi:hypothetical protein
MIDTNYTRCPSCSKLLEIPVEVNPPVCPNCSRIGHWEINDDNEAIVVWGNERNE